MEVSPTNPFKKSTKSKIIQTIDLKLCVKFACLKALVVLFKPTVPQTLWYITKLFSCIMNALEMLKISVHM